MSGNYTIRGGDGKEYGPASLDDMLGWIREGRVDRLSEVRRSDMGHWAQAGQFTELQGAFPVEAPPAISAQGTAAGGDTAVLRQVKSGASWFYTVAVLSMINSVAAVLGSDWRFLFGLGITQVLDILGRQFGGGGTVFTFILDAAVAGMFVLFGVFAGRRHLWAFIVGMVLLVLDTGLMLVFRDWIGAAFHAFILYCLFVGLRACLAVRKAA